MIYFTLEFVFFLKKFNFFQFNIFNCLRFVMENKIKNENYMFEF